MSTSPPPTSDLPAPRAFQRVPTRWDALLLLVGLVAGLLLGPAVLGNLAPNLYQRTFAGGAEKRSELHILLQERDQQLQTIDDMQMTDDYREVYLTQMEEQLAPLRYDAMIEELEHQRTVRAGMHALILAAMVALILAALIGTDNLSLRGRCITVAYAMLAVWLMLALATPGTFSDVSLRYLILPLLAAALAMLIPLGEGQSSEN